MSGRGRRRERRVGEPGRRHDRSRSSSSRGLEDDAGETESLCQHHDPVRRLSALLSVNACVQARRAERVSWG